MNGKTRQFRTNLRFFLLTRDKKNMISMPSFWHDFCLLLCLRARCNLVYQHHNAKLRNVLGPKQPVIYTINLVMPPLSHGTHKPLQAWFSTAGSSFNDEMCRNDKTKTTRSPAKSRVVKKLDQKLKKWTMWESFKDLDRWTSARQQIDFQPWTRQVQAQVKQKCAKQIFLSAAS